MPSKIGIYSAHQRTIPKRVLGSTSQGNLVVKLRRNFLRTNFKTAKAMVNFASEQYQIWMKFSNKEITESAFIEPASRKAIRGLAIELNL